MVYGDIFLKKIVRKNVDKIGIERRLFNCCIKLMMEFVLL